MIIFRITFLIFFFCFGCITESWGQIYTSKLFLQDQFNGGICYTGFNIDEGDLPQNEIDLDIHIEPNSFIRKAYMFYSVVYGQTDTADASLEIQLNNNQPFIIDNSNPLAKSTWGQTGASSNYYHTFSKDITNYITPSNNTLHIELSDQGVYQLPHFARFYFLILYENNSLPLINTTTFYHSGKIWVPLNYHFNNLNGIDNTYPVALSTTISNSGGYWDAYSIYVNSDSLGFIHGNDIQNPYTKPPCFSGTFYHQNQIITGLNEDTANIYMDTSVALANIQNYTSFNAKNLDLDLVYHPDTFWGGTTHDFPDGLSNTVLNFVLSYTPACNATNVDVGFTDTTICKGDTISLNAFGGVKYQWQPSTYLSDSTVANPICNAPHSMWYTCTITNADTCSKTIPVYVNVIDKAKINNLTAVMDTCGFNTGVLVVDANGKSPLTYALDNGNFESGSQFNHLSGGLHQLAILDGNGCLLKETVTIPSTIVTNANFVASPNPSTADSTVELINQSTDYTNSIWYIFDQDNYTPLDSFYTQNASYTFADTGLYNAMLVVYNQTENCADTTYNTIQIVPPFSITIPTVFTPNQDLINDIFTVDLIGAKAINTKIYNRWGNLIYENEAPISFEAQTLPVWDGLTSELTACEDGTYFYVITIITATHQKKSFSGTVQVFR